MALTKPFAENGNKTTIPATTSDGSVSYDQGFGSFYALPPEEGGLFIDRAQFNQLMYDTTSQVLENKNNISALSTQAGQAQGILDTAIKILDESKTSNKRKVITVGTSGADFNNLQDAINEAIKYQNNVRNTGVLWDGYGSSWGSWQVVVRLVTDIELASACQIHLSSGILTIDLNKKTVTCVNDGFWIGSSLCGLVNIINGSIIKKNYAQPYTNAGVRSYSICNVGCDASYIDGVVDSTPGANGYVTIKGFSDGILNGHWGIMSIRANVSNCINCVDHLNTLYTYIVRGNYSSDQTTDGTGSIPIYIRGGGLFSINGYNSVTITSNIPTGGTVRPCINIGSGSTVTTYWGGLTINNTGIATKCNIASNTVSAYGVIYTTYF